MTQITLRQKLDLIPAIASIWLTIIFAALTGLFQRRAKTWYLHICYAVLRKVTRRLSPLQMQWVSPSTSAMYNKYMAKTKQPPRTVSLESGAYGHWIGSPDASHVLIWYHGGGFALPANRGYFKFFARLLADANKSQPNSLSVFCLSYTLAPHAQYPTQLRQAVDCLRHVLETHTPEKVLLGGDSAGGNLVGGVLSHLAHTHPEIKPINLSGAQIKGAIMLSPWTSLDSEFPDQTIDSRGDIITEYVAGPWAGGYLGSAARDFYTDLSRAPTEWYADFPVERMLVCAGGTEIMLPLLEDLVGKMKAGRKVEFVVGERECHVAPVYHLYVGEGTETEQGREVKVFLRECIAP